MQFRKLSIVRPQSGRGNVWTGICRSFYDAFGRDIQYQQLMGRPNNHNAEKLFNGYLTEHGLKQNDNIQNVYIWFDLVVHYSPTELNVLYFVWTDVYLSKALTVILNAQRTVNKHSKNNILFIRSLFLELSEVKNITPDINGHVMTKTPVAI